MSNVAGFTNTQKIKEEAALWLLKMDEKDALSADDASELRDWVASSDTHRKIIIRMSKTWHDMDVLAAMMAPPERKTQSSWLYVKAWLLSPVIAMIYLFDWVILSSLSLVKSKPFALPSVALSACLCVWLFFSMNNSDELLDPANVYTTQIGEHAQHQLPDGSNIWLNSNTKVEVHYSNDFRRIKLLAGEAHFDVEKEPSRPFEVYSNDRLVRAVGTAFSVHKLDDRIEVMVSEGKVELAIVDQTLVIQPDDYVVSTNAVKTVANNMETKPAPITQKLGQLKAGESISIPTASDVTIKSSSNKVIQLDASDIVRKLSWLDGKLVFAGESLEEVVTEISRHTSMRIDVPDPVLRKMRIGGHFEAGETDTLFYVLESGFGIQVNRLDENHVELHAKK